MRLIDADELIEIAHRIRLDSRERIERMIESAPTVDPVRHGHWTDRAKSILGLPTEACSECAEWSIGYEKDYCPNCGAKMDEVEKDESVV